MNNIDQCQKRITFLLQQIDSLEHYLPETYQMLMEELDQQHLLLKQQEIQSFYGLLNDEQHHQTTDSTNQKQTQKSDHQAT